MNCKEVGKKLGKCFLPVACHPFLTSILLLVLALVIGAALFYEYAILIPRRTVMTFESPSLLEEELYQKVLTSWEKREERFGKIDTKEYADPFLKAVPVIEEELTE